MRVKLSSYSSQQKKEVREGLFLDSNSELQEKPVKPPREDGDSCGHTKPGWGETPKRTEFGTHARKTIQRAGGVMDVHETSQLALTFTLPSVDVEAYQAMADYSGYIANRVKTWISDQFPLAEDKLWFYVWELQGRGALHLHFAVSVPSVGIASKIARKAKSLWIRVLETVSRKSGANMFQGSMGQDHRANIDNIQVDCQLVIQSVAQYFAKYCGKDKGKEKKGSHAEYWPSRWWGCSRTMLQHIESLTDSAVTHEIPQDQALEVLNRVQKAV